MNLIDNAISCLPVPSSVNQPNATIYSSLETIQQLSFKSVDTKRWMYHGASLNADQSAIYCIPSNAQRVLKIDLITDACDFIGPSYNGQNKFYGGILGMDGCVYGIPYTGSGVMRIDTRTDLVDLLEIPSGGAYTGKWRWHGGVYCPQNGCIYAFPSHADCVLKIDTTDTKKSGELSLIAIERAPYDDDPVCRYKWLGGCLGVDNCIYGMPSDANTILKIDPQTNIITTFGCLQEPNDQVEKAFYEKNKYQGGVLCPSNGCIYAIPCNAQQVLKINTNLNTSDGMTLFGSLPATKDKYQGGFLGSDGCIYCIPETAERVMKIIPGRFDNEDYIEFI